MVKRNYNQARRQVLWPACIIFFLLPCGVAALEVLPFATRNNSPLVAPFGLPALHDAALLPPGQWQAGAGLAVANNFTLDRSGAESIVLDGETYRYSFTLRKGLAAGLEAGIEVPCVRQTGGHLDSFIESFHDFFGMPDAGRPDAPRNRLLYRYTDSGLTKINVESPAHGVGDIALQFGYQLYHQVKPASRSAAVRVNLKLPTGETGTLLGSGSIDLALRLAGSDALTLQALDLTWYGEMGMLLLTDGKLLADRQRNMVAFGSLGMGWQALDSLQLKFQFDGHTPFYKDSSLDQLSTCAVQVVLGGTLTLPDGYSLDIGVIEDVVLDTVPDVTCQLQLRKVF